MKPEYVRIFDEELHAQANYSGSKEEARALTDCKILSSFQLIADREIFETEYAVNQNQTETELYSPLSI
jgi:hypothetical protein